MSAADDVLIIAENPNETVSLYALKILLEANEPNSSFFAPQLSPRQWKFAAFSRLRILRRENEDITPCLLSLEAKNFFRTYNLPIAYHTLILLTTEAT